MDQRGEIGGRGGRLQLAIEHSLLDVSRDGGWLFIVGSSAASLCTDVTGGGGGSVGVAIVMPTRAGSPAAFSMAVLMEDTQDSTSGSSRATNRYSAPLVSLS